MEDYVVTLFKQERDFEVTKFLSTLPPALEYELLDALYIQKLLKVECFQVCPETVLIALAKELKPHPVVKGEYVFKVGESARETYIISHGIDGAACKIRLEPSTDAYNVLYLTDGDFFGECAVDFKLHADIKRDESAYATQSGELLLLPADSIETIAEDYKRLKRSLFKYKASRIREMTTDPTTDQGVSLSTASAKEVAEQAKANRIPAQSLRLHDALVDQLRTTVGSLVLREPSRVIHVGGLEGPNLEDEKNLAELFGEFGTVLATTLQKRRVKEGEQRKVSWALVSYIHSEDAQNAIRNATRILSQYSKLKVRVLDIAQVLKSKGSMKDVAILHSDKEAKAEAMSGPPKTGMDLLANTVVHTATLLSKVRLFNKMSVEVRLQVASRMQEQEYMAGESIIQVGAHVRLLSRRNFRSVVQHL